MKLHLFITEHLDAILEDWTTFARKSGPAADEMSDLALTDHAAQILRAISLDIKTAQNAEEQFEKSQGEEEPATGDAESAASTHGRLRHKSNFSLHQLSSEFRALRATVLRLWLPTLDQMSASTIYEMVRFNEAIDQALAESIVTYSARADQTRELFLAILGHDLRAPLSNVAVAAELISKAESSADQVAVHATRIKRSVRLMSGMIGDLLGYTRLQMGGGMPTTLAAVDARVVCQAAMEDARAMYPAYQFKFESDGELTGAFDSIRLHQLVTNLLINAAQYGTKNREVTLVAKGGKDDITIQVRNFGTVIPANSLSTIFQPLVQLDPETDDGEARLKTSLGLGLFIAHATAVAHGGDISVTSNVTDGTRFTVRFPNPAAIKKTDLDRMTTS